jgi:phosphomannomutase
MAAKLSFGTAGIRARLGDADHELNLRTVRAVANALCAYLAEQPGDPRTRGLCVGYDGRHESERFAREIAAVGLAHGFVVRSFEHTVPTPLLAFATKLHRAAAGLMVTASHNPPEDNGIKVYFAGGAQILPPHDAEIARRIDASLASVLPPQPAAPPRSGLALALGPYEEGAYLDAVLALMPPEPKLTLPVTAYSALCGVGGALTRSLLARAQVSVVEVSSQAHPRPDLGGLASPNPEHRPALTELITLAERTQAGLAFCHDPDADRLAVLVRDRAGTLHALSGDEVGALLTDFLLAREAVPAECAVISTLVSGGLAERVALAHGAHFERTLTGFKWITARGRALEQAGRYRYLLGYEEAIGYCLGALGDDKDGIAALYVLLVLARKLQEAGSGLHDALERLARQHGLFVGKQVSLSAAGPSGLAHVQTMLKRLRTQPPESWLPRPAAREDHAQAAIPSDLLVFRLVDGSRICVRPSGTEPKLKFYLEVREHVADDEALESARARAELTLSELEAAVRRASADTARTGPAS